MNKGAYTHVTSEGPLDARIVILGESPWINEVASGRPFAGASGNIMKRWWAEAEGKLHQFVVDIIDDNYTSLRPPDPTELVRTNMRIMNLFPYKPPTREISSVPVDKLIKAIEGVHERIAKLKDPYVIIPMGNYATFALTGKGKVNAKIRNAFSSLDFDQGATEAEKKAGITQLRGSIYPYRDLNGRIIKIIPMIHPAAVLQMPKWAKRSVADWRRVKREAGFKEIRDPGRRHIIEPTVEQVEEYCHMVWKGGSGVRMAVDIETWGNQLSCVGFACTPTESITLPTIREHKWTMPYVKWLCECEAQKVLANGSYDWYWLDEYDVQLKNYLWDVQSMHHALDPAESHSLDFLASIYCPHYVFWKDEAKEAEEIVKYAKDAESLWTYNGLDCCYTRELIDLLEGELTKEGMMEFYFNHYQRMFEPLLRVMRHGFKVNVSEQKKGAKQLRGELKELHRRLNEIAGEELFATEERTKLREPTDKEWDELIVPGEVEVDERGITKAKFIDKEVRKKFIEQRGLTYMMSGKNAGKIRYKVIKTKKSFSKDKLAKLFHETLRLPKQFKMRKGKNGKKRTESLDEDSIRKLMYKFKKAEIPGQLLLEYREKERELVYLRGAWDRDGRIRCSYKMNTVAGRLASSKNPMRTGFNLQNLKR